MVQVLVQVLALRLSRPRPLPRHGTARHSHGWLAARSARYYQASAKAG